MRDISMTSVPSFAESYRCSELDDDPGLWSPVVYDQVIECPNIG